MKTKNIYSFLTAFLMMVVASACSDNYDSTLKPSANARYLNLEAEGKTTSDDADGTSIKFNLNAASDNIVVNVESNTLWKVIIDGGGWCSVDNARGSGYGRFIISILNNRTNERSCKIQVVQINAEGDPYDNKSADIEIVQEASEVYITPSSLDIFPSESARQQEFEIVANTDWTLSVRYEDVALTGRFLTVNPVEGMKQTDGETQTFTGTANARFNISLQNNGMAVVRKAYLELKSDNGNFSVEISQQRSQYSFDVSPNTTRYVAAEGSPLTFEVYSPAYNWSVSIPENNDWIICQETIFNQSDQRTPVNMTILPNLSGRERNETIYFKSDNRAYDPVPVIVVQSGFDMTFVVSPNGSPSIVNEAGGEFSFNINSMFDWRIAKTADWITVSRNDGQPSDDAATVNVRIAENYNNIQREDSIKVIPLPTEFAPGIIIDPATVGINTAIVPVTQFGGQQPAVSTPWVFDGYSQTTATVEFGYYSPFLAVSKVGLQLKKETDPDSAWRSVDESDVTDPHTQTVTMNLEGLDPATNYVARGYVIGIDGKTYVGSATVPFRTAGRYPGADDNPTPTR